MELRAKILTNGMVLLTVIAGSKEVDLGTYLKSEVRHLISNLEGVVSTLKGVI